MVWLRKLHFLIKSLPCLRYGFRKKRFRWKSLRLSPLWIIRIIKIRKLILSLKHLLSWWKIICCRYRFIHLGSRFLQNRSWWKLKKRFNQLNQMVQTRIFFWCRKKILQRCSHDQICLDRRKSLKKRIIKTQIRKKIITQKRRKTQKSRRSP